MIRPTKHILFIIFFTTILLTLSCSKDEVRLDDYMVKFASVVNIDSSISIKLDNDILLKPTNEANLTNLKDGDRIIINYTLLDENKIKVNGFRKILLGNILHTETIDKIQTDPIKIISIWRSGTYLNMSIEVNYHSQSHKVGLFEDVNNSTSIDDKILYFSYSRENDPQGAPTLSYLSFDIKELEKKSFSIIINTYEGVRKIEL